MDHVLSSHRRLESKGGQFCQVTKVLACGCMIGTAVLFPLANIEAPWFRFATLSIFIITTLAFTALHIEPFVRFGPFTVPAALLILLLAVLPAGSPRKELVPWLPLFIASSSLVTVAIHELSQRFRIRPRTHSLEEGGSGYSIDTWSRRSTLPRDSSDSQRGRPPPGPSRLDSLLYGQYGPSSHYSRENGDSELGLSDVSGRPRSHWDSPTQRFFQVEASHPEPSDPGQSHPQVEGCPHTRQDSDLVSEDPSASSDQPLLDSRLYRTQFQA